MPHPLYDRRVFINCPFDAEYTPLFEAIVFAVNDTGFRASCARERVDSGETRLTKIIELIGSARYSIHDVSRTTLDETNKLPRFNMPLELGIDIGCKNFSAEHNRKSFLIFDAEQYRFQKYISDIGGQDIQRHDNDPKQAVVSVRNWLRTESGIDDIPGGTVVYARYEQFRRELPAICATLRLDIGDLTFADFSFAIGYWLKP